MKIIIKRLPGLPVERTLGILSGRWKAVILHVLGDGPQRTCELEKRIVGVSQKVLIEQLRSLEKHGLVSRQPAATDPQGIAYQLTPLGESLQPLLESLIDGASVTPWLLIRPIGFCHARLSYGRALDDVCRTSC